jgi:exopolysaccharide biosynthesis protein
MTLGEMADYLAELGVESAINLDGGGSASLVVGGDLVNSPRELEGDPIPGGRPIATAFAFLPRS